MANKSEWIFAATKETEAWLDKLASIMQLKPCKKNGLPKLIFACGSLTEDQILNLIYSVDKDMPFANFQAKWKCNDLNFLKIWYSQEIPNVICELKPISNDPNFRHIIDVWRMWCALYPVYKSVQNLGGLPIHAALINYYDSGVLISAPSGAGKSTCCKRIQPPWKAICDDESLIIPDTQGQYVIHPMPTWSSLFRQNSISWNIQQSFPLKAIFFLEQSEHDDVQPIGQGKTAVLINEASLWIWSRGWRNIDKQDEIEFKKKIFDNSCQLAKQIPAFRLRASLTGKFWEVMEKALETI